MAVKAGMSKENSKVQYEADNHSSIVKVSGERNIINQKENIACARNSNGDRHQSYVEELEFDDDDDGIVDDFDDDDELSFILGSNQVTVNSEISQSISESEIIGKSKTGNGMVRKINEIDDALKKFQDNLNQFENDISSLQFFAGQTGSPMFENPDKHNGDSDFSDSCNGWIESSGHGLLQYIQACCQDTRCKDVVRWTNNKREFEIIDQSKLAEMWGREKKKEGMTKRKLSRSLSYLIKIKGKLVRSVSNKSAYIITDERTTVGQKPANNAKKRQNRDSTSSCDSDATVSNQNSSQSSSQSPVQTSHQITPVDSKNILFEVSKPRKRHADKPLESFQTLESEFLFQPFKRNANSTPASPMITNDVSRFPGYSEPGTPISLHQENLSRSYSNFFQMIRGEIPKTSKIALKKTKSASWLSQMLSTSKNTINAINTNNQQAGTINYNGFSNTSSSCSSAVNSPLTQYESSLTRLDSSCNQNSISSALEAILPPNETSNSMFISDNNIGEWTGNIPIASSYDINISNQSTALSTTEQTAPSQSNYEWLNSDISQITPTFSLSNNVQHNDPYVVTQSYNDSILDSYL